MQESFIIRMLCLSLALCVEPSAISQTPPSEPGSIYTWAYNTPEWNRKLHVSAYRIGCYAGKPSACLKDGLQSAEAGNVAHIIVSLEMNPIFAPTDALAFSELSVSHPALVEVTFDDFVDRYGLMLARPNAPAPSWITTVIHNVKAKNPALQFGITLYEDEITSPYLRPPYLPRDAAQSVDVVHLYLHYRTNAQHFPSYVDAAKAIFPRARIVAGSYPYDRISYIPCARSGKMPCTPETEIKLYRDSIELQAQMLKMGKISAIEFYPGYFGREKQWTGWTEANCYEHSRLQQCIENTLIMRHDAATTLRTEMDW